MVKIENNQVYSTEGRYIHRVGTETYFKRGTTLLSDNAGDYEEVDEIPPYTKEEYDSKVAELVRGRYSESEEFAIQRKAINAAFSPNVANAESALSEYQEYDAFVEECKRRAKEAEVYGEDRRLSGVAHD